MIYYPIETLVKAGIKDILIIISPEYSGHFLNLLGSGKNFDVRFSYEIQEEPTGLPEAFKIGENFIGKDNVTLILGDNIFDQDFKSVIGGFKKGGMKNLFLVLS
jgi:glucose-1-phosphate thymidylyltransferase